MTIGIRDILRELEDVTGSLGLQGARVRWKKNERGEFCFAIILTKDASDNLVRQEDQLKKQLEQAKKVRGRF